MGLLQPPPTSMKAITFDGLHVVEPGRADLVSPFVPAQLADTHVL